MATSKKPSKKSASKSSAQPQLELGIAAPAASARQDGAAPMSTASTSATRQGALAAGDAAAGIGRVRKGFGAGDDDDRLFALGYPAVALLDETEVAAPSGVVACGRMMANLADADFVPRAAALRLVRAMDLGSQLQTFVDGWADGGAAVDDAEAKELVQRALVSADATRTMQLLEALTSSDAVLANVVRALEAVPVEEWRAEGDFEKNGAAAALAMHGLLLRATKAQSSSARAQLETIFARAAGQGDDEVLGRPLRALDLVLHGRAAIERRGDPPRWWQLSYVDDAAYVEEHGLAMLAKMRAADREVPDARVAFNGGDAVKKAFLESEAKFAPPLRPRFQRQAARMS